MKTFTFDTLVTINCDARNSNGDEWDCHICVWESEDMLD